MIILNLRVFACAVDALELTLWLFKYKRIRLYVNDILFDVLVVPDMWECLIIASSCLRVVVLINGWL